MPPTLLPTSSRILALDVVRGFALCGILLVNVAPIAASGSFVPPSTAAGHDTAAVWLGLLAEQRFFPIFSLLFGIGFALLLRSATGRVERPRLLLARRLGWLLAVGLVHLLLLWRGDILTTYAVVGLLVLLPSTGLPRWAAAGLAVACVVASVIAYGGGNTLVPGLFLAGSALVRYGVVDRIERSTRVPLALGTGAAVAAVPTLWWQAGLAADDPAFGTALGVAGLLVATVYVCALLVLLRTPLRAVLAAAFVPLGRMALTNYLTATVVVLLVAWLFGVRGWSTSAALLLACAVLAVQWLVSTLWLRRYRQGPLEWLWRWATWGARPPLRRPARYT